VKIRRHIWGVDTGCHRERQRGNNMKKLWGMPRCVLVAVTMVLTSLTASPAQAVSYSEPVPSWIPNGRVYAIATDASRVYLGGAFTKVKNPATGRSVTRLGLAAFDTVTGELDATWNPGADGRVRALAVAPGVVYVGGEFTSAGGAPATRLAAVDTVTGAAVAGFTASPGGEVRDLAVVDDSLYVAGNFGKVSGVARVGVAKVDAHTGAVNRGWNAKVGSGRAVALMPDLLRDQLVIGGNFKRLAGAEQWFLGAVSLATGARAESWLPQRVCDTCNVIDLDVDGSQVYVATGGGGGGRAAAYATTGNARRWIMRGDGDVQAVDYHDGSVYVGGHFSGDYDLTRRQFAELDAATGSLQSLAVPFTGNDDPGVWAIRADDSAVRIAGGFQGISGFSAARYAVLPAMAQSTSP
jgi:hypothetical protein